MTHWPSGQWQKRHFISTITTKNNKEDTYENNIKNGKIHQYFIRTPHDTTVIITQSISKHTHTHARTHIRARTHTHTCMEMSKVCFRYTLNVTADKERQVWTGCWLGEFTKAARKHAWTPERRCRQVPQGRWRYGATSQITKINSIPFNRASERRRRRFLSSSRCLWQQ